MMLTSDEDFNLTYEGETFSLSDVWAIHIKGDRRYPKKNDTITIVKGDGEIKVKWSEVTDDLARLAILSVLAPV